MAVTLKFKENTLVENLNEVIGRLGSVVLLYAGTKASIIEAWMKQNRPWTDQTGAAKASLNASVTTLDDGTVRITLSHGVAYGIWLELAKEKNFAIIDPAIKRFQAEIMEDLQGIFGEINKSWSAGGKSLGSAYS